MSAGNEAMLRGSWLAWRHIRFFFPRKGCAIWRITTCFGLRRHAIFCSCGEIFAADEIGRGHLRQMGLSIQPTPRDRRSEYGRNV